MNIISFAISCLQRHGPASSASACFIQASAPFAKSPVAQDAARHAEHAMTANRLDKALVPVAWASLIGIMLLGLLIY